MSGMLRSWGLVTAMAVLLAAGGAARACPFCEAPDVTLSQQLHLADVATLVQWVDGKAPNRDEGFAGSTTYEIIKVVHDSSGTLKAGERFDIVRHRAGQPGEMFLMLGSYTTVIEWGSPIEVTETSFNYIVQAPTREVPTAERLRYFIRFLEYSDNLIAGDAFAEFAGADYKDVASLVDVMPREKLHKWLAGDIWGDRGDDPRQSSGPVRHDAGPVRQR
ncbi:MAG: hypothetical protein R3B90_22110 [Planctomycetaceae bacterium]